VAEGIWLRLAFRGDQRRLLAALAESGATARRLQERGGKVELDVPAADILTLRSALRQRGGGRLLLRGHGGWPLALRALRRRPWRLLAPLVATLLYLWAASHVWQVAVAGPRGIPATELTRTARRLGLYPGALRASLDPFRLGQELQTRVPGLIFAAVRVDGVRAVIYAAPALRPPRALPPAHRGALLAGEAGYVTRVVVLRGQALVRPGDTVVRGEPLVAPRDGTSDAQVFARVWRTFDYTFADGARLSYESVRRSTAWFLAFARGRQWAPLGLGTSFAEARRSVQIWRIPFTSVEVGRYTYAELRTLKVRHSATYARLRATSLALATLRRTMPGARLLELQTRVRRSGGELRTEVRVEAETDIAQAEAGGGTQD